MNRRWIPTDSERPQRETFFVASLNLREVMDGRMHDNNPLSAFRLLASAAALNVVYPQIQGDRSEKLLLWLP